MFRPRFTCYLQNIGCWGGREGESAGVRDVCVCVLGPQMWKGKEKRGVGRREKLWSSLVVTHCWKRKKRGGGEKGERLWICMESKCFGKDCILRVGRGSKWELKRG